MCLPANRISVSDQLLGREGSRKPLWGPGPTNLRHLRPYAEDEGRPFTISRRPLFWKHLEGVGGTVRSNVAAGRQGLQTKPSGGERRGYSWLGVHANPLNVPRVLSSSRGERGRGEGGVRARSGVSEDGPWRSIGVSHVFISAQWRVWTLGSPSISFKRRVN